MAESQGQSVPVPDPFGLWKQMIEAQGQAWSRLFQEMMGTEAFAATTGRYLDNLLNVRGTIEKGLEQQFRALNLPSRSDFTRLATEVAELRTAVDRLTERIDELSAQATGPAPAPATEQASATGQPTTGRRARGARQSRAKEK